MSLEAGIGTEKLFMGFQCRINTALFNRMLL